MILLILRCLVVVVVVVVVICNQIINCYLPTAAADKTIAISIFMMMGVNHGMSFE